MFVKIVIAFIFFMFIIIFHLKLSPMEEFAPKYSNDAVHFATHPPSGLYKVSIVIFSDISLVYLFYTGHPFLIQKYYKRIISNL